MHLILIHNFFFFSLDIGTLKCFWLLGPLFCSAHVLFLRASISNFACSATCMLILKLQTNCLDVSQVTECGYNKCQQQNDSPITSSEIRWKDFRYFCKFLFQLNTTRNMSCLIVRKASASASLVRKGYSLWTREGGISALMK